MPLTREPITSEPITSGERRGREPRPARIGLTARHDDLRAQRNRGGDPLLSEELHVQRCGDLFQQARHGRSCARCGEHRRAVRAEHQRAVDLPGGDRGLVGDHPQLEGAGLSRFAVDGFHARSMDDIIWESGLSAGAVHRYCASKDELILAAVSEALRVIRTDLDTLLDTRDTTDPGQALAEMLARHPDRVARLERGHSRHDAAHRLAAGRHHPGGLDPEATAPLVLSIAMGYVVQRAVLGDRLDVTTYERAFASLLVDHPGD